MSLDLSFYSKKKLELFYSLPINQILTDSIFYDVKRKTEKEYEGCDVFIGSLHCIDDLFIEDNIDLYENIIDSSGDIEKQVQYFKPIIILSILENIKSKMIEYGLADKTLESNYRSNSKEDIIFPYYSNLTTCLDWIKELNEDDEIILIAI